MRIMKHVVVKFALSFACTALLSFGFGAELKTKSAAQKPLPVREVTLPALAPDFVTALKNQQFSNEKGRYQIGLGRDFDKPVIVSPQTVPSSEWSTQPDGSRVWSLQVTSEGALGTRLHIEQIMLPTGVTLRVYDPQKPGTSAQIITQKNVSTEGDVWTETIFSQTVVIECDVPANAEPSQVSFTATGLSHLYSMPVTQTATNLKEGTCHLDVTCYSAYADEASGVARITFVDGGNSYLCSGCLLASAAASDDFFLTAHHCITSQTIASSMECFWFYQTSTCNGTPPDISSVPHTSGGGDLLAGSTESDFTFMRLRQSPPGGAGRLQWSTATPTSSETLASIHHPTGAYKRISFGTFLDSSAGFWAVKWSRGVTEPGSSGGPLLNGNHEVIGQLNGGWNGPGSSCQNPTAPDQYGRFDVTYPSIQKWLGDGGGGGGGADTVFPPKGTYSGLFSDSSNPTAMASSGYATLTESSKGKFSGRVQIGTRKYSFHGQFDGSGAAQVHVSRGAFQGMDITLQYDNSSGEDQLLGTISSDGDWQAQLVLNRAAFDGRNNVAPQMGRYTFIIPGSPGSTDDPGGDSYATVSVDKSGRVKLSGSLADGTKFSQSATLSANGEWPLYVGLYSGQGALYSWLTVAGDASAVNGTITWIKLQTFRTKYYKSGFVVGSSIVSSSFIRPFSGGTVLDLSDGQVTLAGGDLGGAIADSIQAAGRRIINTGDNRLSLSFSTSTGTFSGRMTDANSGFSYPFHGVVLQSQNQGSGYFTGPSQTGEVTVQAVAPDQTSNQTTSP
jgi:hypothetical protein